MSKTIRKLKNLVRKILVGSMKPGVHQIKYGIGAGIQMVIDPASKAQRIYGLDERELFPLFKHYAKHSTVFIDIGASDGYYGLLFKNLNKEGSVYLFDGSAEFLAEQQQNFTLNNLEFASHEAKLVGASNTEGMTCVDEYFKEVVGSFFIKIDVEGAELDVLKGALTILKTRKCCLIIETHGVDVEKACLQLLQETGYTMQIIKAAWWRRFVPEARSLDHNRWIGGANYLS
ncbi:MAG: FkbM family methyltransferase [Imperialibacter sp.]|uniref:FkbM family methyltransferase n=1 Tax=Imperialibacter sp. TaxID=2038411 RepID=UPI0032EA9238